MLPKNLISIIKFVQILLNTFEVIPNSLEDFSATWRTLSWQKYSVKVILVLWKISFCTEFCTMQHRYRFYVFLLDKWYLFTIWDNVSFWWCIFIVSNVGVFRPMNAYYRLTSTYLEWNYKSRFRLLFLQELNEK